MRERICMRSADSVVFLTHPFTEQVATEFQVL